MALLRSVYWASSVCYELARLQIRVVMTAKTRHAGITSRCEANVLLNVTCYSLLKDLLGFYEFMGKLALYLIDA